MVARPFRHEAENRQARLRSATRPSSHAQSGHRLKRLQQVLKNLLSNAFKFTEHGSVRLSVSVAQEGWSEDHPILPVRPRWSLSRSADTGIGIPPDKQRIIFEAFQQADAGTSRKYGGTGSVLPSAANWPACSAEKFNCAAHRAREAPSRCICRRPMSGPLHGAAEVTAERRPVATPLQLSGGRTLPSSRLESVPDDRDRPSTGRCRSADRGRRSSLRASAVRSGA